MKKTVASLALLLALGACSSSADSAETPSATAETDDAAAATPAEEQPTPTPAPAKVPTHRVGEAISSPTADIVVNTIEQRDVVVTDFEADYTPGEGERLWYVDITWTNNLAEAVGKECHGPYAMNLSAFDITGREMLMVDQPGFIAGQECSTGLMQGQTGTWLSAFRGLDADFGWLVFDDYNGEPVTVVLDPELELFYDE